MAVWNLNIVHAVADWTLDNLDAVTRHGLSIDDIDRHNDSPDQRDVTQASASLQDLPTNTFESSWFSQRGRFSGPHDPRTTSSVGASRMRQQPEENRTRRPHSFSPSRSISQGPQRPRSHSPRCNPAEHGESTTEHVEDLRAQPEPQTDAVQQDVIQSNTSAVIHRRNHEPQPMTGDLLELRSRRQRSHPPSVDQERVEAAQPTPTEWHERHVRFLEQMHPAEMQRGRRLSDSTYSPRNMKWYHITAVTQLKDEIIDDCRAKSFLIVGAGKNCNLWAMNKAVSVVEKIKPVFYKGDRDPLPAMDDPHAPASDMSLLHPGTYLIKFTSWTVQRLDHVRNMMYKKGSELVEADADSEITTSLTISTSAKEQEQKLVLQVQISPEKSRRTSVETIPEVSRESSNHDTFNSDEDRSPVTLSLPSWAGDASGNNMPGFVRRSRSSILGLFGFVSSLDTAEKGNERAKSPCSRREPIIANMEEPDMTCVESGSDPKDSNSDDDSPDHDESGVDEPDVASKNSYSPTGVELGGWEATYHAREDENSPPGVGSEAQEVNAASGGENPSASAESEAEEPNNSNEDEHNLPAVDPKVDELEIAIKDENSPAVVEFDVKELNVASEEDFPCLAGVQAGISSGHDLPGPPQVESGVRIPNPLTWAVVFRRARVPSLPNEPSITSIQQSPRLNLFVSGLEGNKVRQRTPHQQESVPSHLDDDLDNEYDLHKSRGERRQVSKGKYQKHDRC